MVFLLLVKIRVGQPAQNSFRLLYSSYLAKFGPQSRILFILLRGGDVQLFLEKLTIGREGEGLVFDINFLFFWQANYD